VGRQRRSIFRRGPSPDPFVRRKRLAGFAGCGRREPAARYRSFPRRRAAGCGDGL